MIKIPIIVALVMFGIYATWAQIPKRTATLAPVETLRQKALPVTDEHFSSGELHTLTENLAKEMFSHLRILGIAAPQMNVGLRVFLLRSSSTNPFNRSYEVFINPVISTVEDATDTGIEFCLSTSGFHRVERHERIRLAFSKLDGSRHEIELTGSKARIAQHELDHLDGKLISD